MEEKTVDLSLTTLMKECSINPNLVLEHQSYFRLKNRENVHEVFRYKKFNDDFVDTVSCYRKEGELIGIIRPSYDEFLRKIVNALNLPVYGKIIDNDDLTRKLLERVEDLKKIKSERELYHSFPQLYKDLHDGRRYYEQLQQLRKREHYQEDEYASGEHYYYGCAMKRSLGNFIKTQSELFSRFILKRLEYKSLVESTTFNSYIRRNFDIDKLNMYIMHKYLCKCEETTEKDVIQKYISLVEQYLAGPRDKTVSIETEEGIIVNYDMICNRLENAKRVIQKDSSLVEWILIPEGRDYSKVKQEKASRTTFMNLEEVKKLEALGERKRTFYESSPYLAKVLGLRRYHGYVGYIYENGKVVLDREYISHHPSSASGDAIYIMNVSDFEELSRYDKQELIQDKRVKRMNHTATWEERLHMILDTEADSKTKEEARQLVKRLKEKRD